MDARIKDMAEMEEKGYRECEDGHEERDLNDRQQFDILQPHHPERFWLLCQRTATARRSSSGYRPSPNMDNFDPQSDHDKLEKLHEAIFGDGNIGMKKKLDAMYEF